MSNVNTALVKRPFKLIDVALNKFKNEVIPYHQELFLKHKTNINKLSNIADYEQLDRELKDKKRVIRQLKELMYELDTLRTQVEDFDLDTFDEKTVSLRKIILELINDYSGVEKEARLAIEEYKYDTQEKNIFQDTSQIQIQDDIEALKSEECESQYRKIQALNKDIEAVHSIFVDLNKMVETQNEHVDNIEVNIEVGHDNVKGGLLHLVKASKLKKATYPVAGAFIGTLVGGPIGSVAGLKIGAFSAVCCAFAGYIGGRVFRKMDDKQIAETEVELQSTTNNTLNSELPITTANDKKDM